jgi:hypothetical protein
MRGDALVSFTDLTDIDPCGIVEPCEFPSIARMHRRLERRINRLWQRASPASRAKVAAEMERVGGGVEWHYLALRVDLLKVLAGEGEGKV